ncbi:MAG: hypothetical protein M1827_007029 [Pycnora praestabilis]|nr:MAG: hypothetical protein M1827_007029 [Pycnora praestabilis]
MTGAINDQGFGHDLDLQQISFSHSLVNGSIPVSTGDRLDTDDNRSSSLSDIDDIPDVNDAVADHMKTHTACMENESEAETERLEHSPQNVRKNKNVVLVEEDASIDRTPSKVAQEMGLHKVEKGLLAVPDVVEEDKGLITDLSGSIGDVDPTSAATSIDSPTEAFKITSPPDLAGRKRKRKSQETPDVVDEVEAEEPARKRAGAIKVEPTGNSFSRHASMVEHGESEAHYNAGDPIAGPAGDFDDEMEKASSGDTTANEPDISDDMTGTTTKTTKGKRIRRNSTIVKGINVGGPVSVEDEEAHNGDSNDVIGENGNGGVNGDEGEDVEEAEAAARNEEEATKKKSAHDSLGTLEKQFAIFRDKIYDERLASLSNALVLLKQPNPSHPEYLAMLQCIDARRDEKINLENTLLRYKIKSLEMKSIAERSQLHSQYFQTTRAVRENKLEEVGEQWYQIQRDRRGLEGTVPDFTYKFPTRRSQQIIQQTAYNMEVSVLSGVAKYHGFPAAPSVDGARPSEIEEDLQKMGIKPPVRPVLNHGLQPLPTMLSTPPIPRLKPAAEEQFLEQTPWANPQHPVHQQHIQQLQRKAVQQPRAESPISVSAIQKRSVDPSALNGSDSVVGNSSMTISVPQLATNNSFTAHNEQSQPESAIVDDVGTKQLSPFSSNPGTMQLAGKETNKSTDLRAGSQSPSSVRRRTSLQVSTTPATGSPNSLYQIRSSAASAATQGPGIQHNSMLGFQTYSPLGRNFGSSPGFASMVQDVPIIKQEETVDNNHLSSPNVGPPHQLRKSGIAAGVGLERFGDR